MYVSRKCNTEFSIFNIISEIALKFHSVFKLPIISFWERVGLCLQ